MSPKTPLTAIRWYAPDLKTENRLLASGAVQKYIYRGDRDERPDKIKLRAGECLGIVGGLRTFGGKVAIKKVLKYFHDQGVTILDVETGQDSRTHGVEMFDAATGPRRQSSEYNRMMAVQRSDAYRKKHGMASKGEAQKTWHTPGLSVSEKMTLTGWSRGALYAAFGRSGAPAGRRPNGISDTDAPPPKHKRGFVYFMRIDGKGHVKIGFAKEISKRLKQHGTSTPGEPQLVGFIPGTVETEGALHKKYAALCVRGEWFKYAGALKDFVETLPTK